MIPIYLNLRDLNLIDKRLTMIIAFACSAFYVILLRTFFQAIPESLEESAKIDGASDISVLWNIYLPMSLPALATLGLYYAVGRWNAYFWAMIVLKDDYKMPLQVLMMNIIVKLRLADEYQFVDFGTPKISQETLIYTNIVVTVIPIILVYPFIQKYFVKGITIGALKG
jgi:putative aldouronate transport system permease protein